jgi:hypothetical protein
MRHSTALNVGSECGLVDAVRASGCICEASRSAAVRSRVQTSLADLLKLPQSWLRRGSRTWYHLHLLL